MQTLCIILLFSFCTIGFSRQTWQQVSGLSILYHLTFSLSPALTKQGWVAHVAQENLTCSPSQSPGQLLTCIYFSHFSPNCGIFSHCPLSQPPHIFQMCYPSITHALSHTHQSIIFHDIPLQALLLLFVLFLLSSLYMSTPYLLLVCEPADPCLLAPP